MSKPQTPHQRNFTAASSHNPWADSAGQTFMSLLVHSMLILCCSEARTALVRNTTFASADGATVLVRRCPDDRFPTVAG